jgi:hypothetical protein
MDAQSECQSQLYMEYTFIVEGATCIGLMTSHRQAKTKNICEKEKLHTSYY